MEEAAAREVEEEEEAEDVDGDIRKQEMQACGEGHAACCYRLPSRLSGAWNVRCLMELRLASLLRPVSSTSEWEN